MANRLKLYVDWLNKKLIKGPANAGNGTLPTFFQGDVLPIEVRIYEPDTASGSAGPNSFSQIDISGMSLKLAVSAQPTGDAAESPYVTQFSWSQETSSSDTFFYAEVAFNTAALDTALGSNAQILNQYLELETTEGTAVSTILQRSDVTIKAEVIEDVATSVPAGQTPLSLEVANQMYAAKRMNNGETIVIPSPNGAYAVRIGCNNDKSVLMDVITLT